MLRFGQIGRYYYKTCVMKKFIFLFFLAAAAKSTAQNVKGWYLEGRVTGGHSWYSQQDNNLFHPYLQTAANFVYQSKKIISFGTGVGFSSEGYSDQILAAESKTITRANYVRVPLFARLMFSPESRTRPYADAGLSLGFFTGGQTKNYFRGKFSSEQKTSPINKNDMGLFTHAGISSQLSAGVTLNGSVSYYHGFVQQKALTGLNVNPPISNRNIGVGLGLQYRLN